MERFSDKVSSVDSNRVLWSFKSLEDDHLAVDSSVVESGNSWSVICLFLLSDVEGDNGELLGWLSVEFTPNKQLVWSESGESKNLVVISFNRSVIGQSLGNVVSIFSDFSSS